MLAPENSRMLAKKKQIAILKKDAIIIEKIEKIEKDSEITEEIKNYN